MAAPSVALWGTGGPASAHAAACLSLGWSIRFVVGDDERAAARLAAEHGAGLLTGDELAASHRADVVILTERRPVDEICTVLDSGHHLLIAPPLADTLADADAIVSYARAAARGQRLLYGDAVCAAPVVEDLLTRVPGMAGEVSHISSKVVQPPPLDVPLPRSPLHNHGVHGVAAALLAARLADRGVPSGVAGERRGPDDPVTEVRLHYAAGEPVRVHASFGPPSGPAWDLQVASADEVLRVDLLPVPTLERNGEPLPLSAGAATDPAHAFGFVRQLVRFWADIGADRSPMLPPEFGRDVLEIVCAAHASADGSLIDLPFTGPRDLRPEQLEPAT